MIRSYLVAFNAVSTLGWVYLLGSYFGSLIAHGYNYKLAYYDLEFAIRLVQTLAVMEVVHTATGLVRSPVMTTAIQVASRLCMVWIIMQSAPHSIGIALCILAWGVTEIVRYPFYALSLLGIQSSVVLYLRYTLFIVLYPLGVTGELLTQYHAFMAQREWTPYSMILSIMPAFYILLFPKMYLYMFSQRKKVLGKPSTDKTK